MSSKPKTDPFSPISPAKKPSKADKGAAGAKFWIMSLDDSSVFVSAQYNPKELQVDRTVPWSPAGESGQGNATNESPGGVDLEFTGAKGRSLSVDLLFDGYESQAAAPYKVTVQDQIKQLEKLASVRKPKSKKEDERRPHLCIAAWGPALKIQCVIESISTKYTMFDRDGTPLRATCTLKLTEADSVRGQKAGGAAPPAGGGTSGGTGGA